MKTFEWTRKRVETTIKMWNDGASGAAISSAVGASRSAIVGKIRRLRETGTALRMADPIGVNMRQPIVKTSEGPATGYVVTKTNIRDADRIEVLKQDGQKRVKALEAQMPGSGVALESLSRRCCRFPTGEVGTDILFCGEPVSTRSYCESHSKRVYAGRAA